jgi:signal transduction histidine kinase
MSEASKVADLSRNVAPARTTNDDDLKSLRRRLAELEIQNQQLFQQTFLLQQRLSSSSLTEKERAEFISNVAHELRTPLTSIKGYVDLVLQGETGPINELQNEFLSIVGANADRLAQIISDLLDVSKLEAGRIGFKPEICDLSQVLEEVTAQVKPQLDAIKIELALSLPNERLTASLDIARFSQAIRAILAHAGQVTPENGRVTFGVRQDETGANAVIQITDGGPRIAEEDLSRVFTKFWRPINPLMRDTSGPGLGLSIAKAIVDTHEGRLEAANGENGTIFSIIVPLVNRAVGTVLPDEPTDEANPHYAALVITQSADYGKVMESVLTRRGFQVLISEDLGELVADSPAWQPDLIINDGSLNDYLSKTPEELPPALRTATILALNLSPLEQLVLRAGAEAILPYPQSESALVDQLMQIAGIEDDRQPSLLVMSASSEALRTLDRLSEAAGFNRIHRAMREADALTLARRFRPDWLLLDLSGMLPAPGATETMLHYLREESYLEKTPAIVLLPPDQIAPAPLPAYQPARRGTGALRRRRTDELGLRAGATAELRRRGTGELRRGGTGELRRGGTGELRPEENRLSFYNVVPKPYLQRRFTNLALTLLGSRNASGL